MKLQLLDSWVQRLRAFAFLIRTSSGVPKAKTSVLPKCLRLFAGLQVPKHEMKLLLFGVLGCKGSEHFFPSNSGCQTSCSKNPMKN
jgi:hypothetical protein